MSLKLAAKPLLDLHRNSTFGALPGDFSFLSGHASDAKYAWSRQPFAGSQPLAQLEWTHGQLVRRSDKIEFLTHEAPLQALDDFLSEHGIWTKAPSGRFAVIALSYEFGSRAVFSPKLFPQSNPNPGFWPELWMGIYEQTHATPKNPDELLSQAPSPVRAISHSFSSNFTGAAYCDRVQRIIDYIQSGDIYQANLAQCFELPWPKNIDAYEFFLRILATHSAPFAGYLRLPDDRMAMSLSPERFLKIQDGRIITQPIKGTAPRGATPAEDIRQKNWLWQSQKNQAELTMIVDLERNDLGKICEPGSVKAAAIPTLRSFSTVHHLVGEISGQLLLDLPLSEVIRATFPGGSVTGAPKIRAMQIINEIEGTPRGLFTGAFGIIGPGHSLDWNIPIRTFMCCKDRLLLHAGAGITAESIPELEYAETLAKVGPLLDTAIQSLAY